MRQLIEDRWHWVTIDGEKWFPAKRTAEAVGGWWNGDTWEDWDKEVTDWQIIPLPRKTRPSCAQS
ncbi:MAG: hypothetical protein MUE60_16570 [Candidatus Eisenbacteria bacterium]|jgi:hypothetical protein|nr:hypothetical protein [Candidatus Eisenbacteria bacterium]